MTIGKKLGSTAGRRLCLVGLVLGAATAASVSGGGAAETTIKTVPPSRAAIELSFAPVVRDVAPAVVNIFSKRMVRERRRSPLFDDPFFRRFFGDRFGAPERPRERMNSSLGSGVIVSSDGLIVTNHHVIANGDEITVVLHDRREFEASLVLDDERTDLAVLRIDAGDEPLPRVQFRDSDEVEVGDLVLAIGNPFGVGQTVTSGIVSATARTQTGISDYSFFIQTDAAINPGNSGGALVTLDGKLLGINTAIFSRSGGSIGIGFAIPANMVRTVVASALTGQAVVRPWAGLIGQPLTRDLAEGFGLNRPAGVIVNEVYRRGPADEAGIRNGDVILAVDGRDIADVESFRFRIATRPLGEAVPLTIWRQRQTLEVKFPLMAAPETPPRDETRLSGRQPLAGALVANLSPALAEELELAGEWEGAIILGLERGSSAHRLGFRRGDIVLSVNGTDVDTVRGLERLLRRSDDRWRIGLKRNGQVRTVEFTR